ncbi:MAG: formyltetrahydrofolate deformylase, partial [Candidatus Omnitrophica bacterium]|nr:formyltetrahydrofolate deformylase [Candidatus Omnitrophota bacterium]
MSSAVLLISCPDQKGITATVTNFISTSNGNILHADQHIDDQSNTFFMRIEWSLKDFHLSRELIAEKFGHIAQTFNMSWELFYTDNPPRVAIFVSRHLHCLIDILYRHKAGRLDCEIPLVISNHKDAEKIVRDYGIEFVYLPVTKENKEEQEQKQLEILKLHKIELILLARYHQIFTKSFVEHYPNKIINIHHSFLPAFAGGSPYAQAYQKGVKLIGATSHYVTEILDEGPIIEQD